jgi:hypothetical protein
MARFPTVVADIKVRGVDKVGGLGTEAVIHVLEEKL